MNQGPLRTPYDKNPGAQSDEVRCGGMGGWADGEVMLRKSGRGLANSTRADTHTHTNAHPHTYCASLQHTQTLALCDGLPSRLHPVLQSASVPVPASRASPQPQPQPLTACPAPKRPPSPRARGSSRSGQQRRRRRDTHTHMSRHPTQAGQESHRLLYKSVGEAGNVGKGKASASSDGKTMISMATHDTRSESDGRSAFGSPGAEAAPASDSTEGGPITLNVFPNRAAGPCAGLFYVVMRLDGAPSTATVRSRQASLEIGGYLEATSRGDARRPEGRRRR